MSTAEAEGDARTRFDALCGALRPDLYRYAFWLARDRAVAEDVVQDTLLRAWRAFDGLDKAASARAWLCTIARREFARRFERKQLEVVDVADLATLEDPALTVEDGQQIMDIRADIWALHEDYREPLVLQVLMGFSTDEIAAQLGLTGGAVLTRLFRARQKLRITLGVGGDEP
ncbi:MAG: sigma-70 family RNA polymerase sigma factor [Pseudomonadota bacterium]